MKVLSSYSFLALITLLILTPLINTSFAKEGHGGGNGGDAVVCLNQPVFLSGEPVNKKLGPVKIEKIELLDFWEGRKNDFWKELSDLELKNVNLSLGGSHINYDTKIKQKIEFIRGLNQELGEELRKRFLRFYQETKLLPRNEIDDLQDANYIPLDEENCYVRQFAVQYANTPSYGNRYKIDKELFENPVTSEDTKAGLILHELLLGIAIDLYNVSNSDFIRPLNYLLNSELAESLRLDNNNSFFNKSTMKNLLTKVDFREIEGRLEASPLICNDRPINKCIALKIKVNDLLKKVGFSELNTLTNSSFRIVIYSIKYNRKLAEGLYFHNAISSEDKFKNQKKIFH